jgi:hypothetical protein
MYYSRSYKKTTRIGKQRKIRPFQRLSHVCSSTRSTFANNPHDRERSPAQMKIEATYKPASVAKTKPSRAVHDGSIR